MNRSSLTSIVFLTLLISGTLFGQEEQSGYDKSFVRHELYRYKSSFQRTAQSTAADERFDVTYYKLDIRLTTSPNYLRGSVTMNAASRVNGLAAITLDLMSSMSIDSIRIGGLAAAFLQHASSFDVTLDRTYNSGEMISINIFYEGIPGSSGFGSFEFSSHSATPWVWSLSEPYGAKDWWPCKDHPADKADSADILVRCDTAYRVGSNGKLISVTNHGDGTHTYHWQERYPISTYLVSVAVTNYAAFSNWFKYTPTDSMEVLNYVLPEHLASAQANLPLVVGMLHIYSDLFGLYPFIQEKYGHSEFGWGGGMEHQTMTSLGGFSEGLTAHELAHQWFGDMITCRTWPDIWLNEGFATYCEILYREQKYGTGAYWGGVAGVKASARAAVGTLSIVDTANIGVLFGWNLVYAKGATVLHMLRHVLGDSVFFKSMYDYAHHPSYRFGTASTADFRSMCESTSGKDLTYFFNEWVYGQNYPHYRYGWTSQSTDSGYAMSLDVRQTTGTSNPSFFTMPIDFKILSTGWDTTVTLFNNSSPQAFSLTVSHKPLSIQLDAQGWILQINDTVKPFVAYPAALSFGTVSIFDSKTDSISVSNAGFLPLTISSIVSDDTAFSIAPTSATITPSGVQKFLLMFHPTTAGARTGHLSFFHDGPGSPDKFTVYGTGAAQAYTVAPRWNLMSLPLLVTDPRPVALFPTTVSAVYAYDSSGVYMTVDSLRNGIGYWVKFATGQQIGIVGLPLQAETVDVHTGWNLIGSLMRPFPVSSIVSMPPGIATSNWFGYEGNYVTTDSIFPARGYWVKTQRDGLLVLTTNSAGAMAQRIRIVPTRELPPTGPQEDVGIEEPPKTFALSPAYPNPFNPRTLIRYQLPVASRVSLKIYNVLGILIATLRESYEPAGEKSVEWEARGLASGVYFYQLEAVSLDDPANTFTQMRKAVLVK